MIPDNNTPPEQVVTANPRAMNGLIVYIANKVHEKQLESQYCNQFILSVLTLLKNDARKYLIIAISNQLRFPNAHTQFASYLMLFLFDECNSSLIQE